MELTDFLQSVPWSAVFFWLVVIVIGCIVWSLAFAPVYNVWAARKAGEADLARAQNEQRIQIAEAEGRFHAAETNKQAAIIEAEAVAEQINKIGANLQKHDLYLRWQWIKMMEQIDTKHSIVYVPTEANLPVLEAGRAVQR